MATNAPVDLSREIEQFLLEKFEKGLEFMDRGASKVALSRRFKDLKDLLEGKLNSPARKETDQKNIRDHLYYINNVLAEYRMLSWKQIIPKVRINRSLEEIILQVQKIPTPVGGAPPAQDGRVAEPSESQESSPEQLEVKEEALRTELILLETLAQKPSAHRFKAIAIVGAGGIGKTTLCRLFFDKEEEKKEYLPRIWVNMSRLPAKEEALKVAIVERMLMHLGVECTDAPEDKKLSTLVSLLHRHLWGKKYLIVLDNAHAADDEWCQNLVPSSDDSDKLGPPIDDKYWGERLAHGLPKGYGGMVIVTCRSEELAMKMVGTENMHSMMPLSDPEICWSIFQDSAKLHQRDSPPDDLKGEVSKKSAGFPLIAKIIGEISKNRTPPANASTDNANANANASKENPNASTVDANANSSTENANASTEKVNANENANSSMESASASTEKANANASPENASASTEKANANAFTENANVNASTEKGNANASTENTDANASMVKGNANASTEKANANSSTENANSSTEKANSS